MSDTIRKFTYHINWDDVPPNVNEYLVSLIKKGIGMIYRVHSVRKVNQRVPSDCAKYAIECIPQLHLKELTDHDESSHEVWVKGEPAHPMRWIPRTKKK